MVNFREILEAADAGKEEAQNYEREIKKKNGRGNRSMALSFSASLPEDVCAAVADFVICGVKYSLNPCSDIRESILEMIDELEICYWSEMEDLVYCYIALNPPEVHHAIADAFLSLNLAFPDP